MFTEHPAKLIDAGTEGKAEASWLNFSHRVFPSFAAYERLWIQCGRQTLWALPDLSCGSSCTLNILAPNIPSLLLASLPLNPQKAASRIEMSRAAVICQHWMTAAVERTSRKAAFSILPAAGPGAGPLLPHTSHLLGWEQPETGLGATRTLVFLHTSNV